MSDNNPLVTMGTPIPFDRMTAEHVRPAMERLIGEARARIEAIAKAPARTWESTPGAYDRATEGLDWAMKIVEHLESVASTPELRDAYNDVQPEVSALYASLPLHAGLWAALKEYEGTAEAGALTGVRKRYLVKTIDWFRRHGAELDAAGKKRLEEIDVELATATTKFGQNVMDSTAQFEWVATEETELAGLPASAIDAARERAEAKGIAGWRFTLQMPSYEAVMKYLADGGGRERFWRAYQARATEPERNNPALAERVVELRREKARLLGYGHFADLVLADRMAKSGRAARGFVDDLEAKTRVHFERENRELEAYAGRRLAPWDVTYWAEKKRVAEYAFEEEDLRPYFSLERVLAGLFELVRRLYGVTVGEAPGVPVWHPDVKHYEMREEDGTLLATFYADWHTREVKRQGAWMGAFVTGGPEEGGWKPHVGLMCGNMTAPLKDRPSLLTHREVETVFHEFGHLLHHCLSKVEVRGLAGTHVAWDFVELPSQIMENWCWERESLDLFARHWETGEVIPEELYQKMTRARTYRGANGQMRQLGFGTVDLALHMEYDAGRDGDVLEYSRRVLERFSPAALPAPYGLIAGFTHLFGDAVGYGAGYYSYKWAEVLDADAFSRFRQGGLFSREVGQAFREQILSKGDSEDPAELYRRFMGRDPDSGALLRRLGLSA